MSKVAIDTEWRARDDLYTLTEAAKIRKDPKRLKAAKAYAKKRLQEQKQDMEATKALID